MTSINQLWVATVSGDEIGIVALPDSLFVRAASKTSIEKREGELIYSEFDYQTLFERIPMPVEIDVTQIKANLENGLLRIAARKMVGEGRGCRAACGTCRGTKGASRCS